jgi:hypothetical protein
VPQAPLPFSGAPLISYHEVFTALTLLQGRTRLIRHRLDRIPASQRPAVAVTLDELEILIASLSHQLEAACRAGLGPPF